MKIKSLLVSVLLLLSLCACSSGTPVVEVSEGRPLIGAFQSGTPSETSGTSESAGITETPESSGKPLTLFFTGYKAMENQPIYIMAQEFMKKHPGAVIEFSYVDTSVSYNPENLRKQLLGLNSGTGADIIAINGAVSYEGLKTRIEFLEFNEMMDRDLNLARSDYFENILDAMSEDGKMYVMPVSVNFTYFSLNRKYENLLEKPFEQYETITFERMLDIYEMAKREYRGTSELYLTDFPVYATAVSWAYDLSGMYAEGLEFPENPEVNRELLRRYFETPELSYELYLEAQDESGNPSGLESVFGRYDTNPLGYPDSEFTKPVVLAGLNGEVSFDYSLALGINAKSGDIPLAWEFVKFCMNNKPIGAEGKSEPDSQDYVLWGSINKESFRGKLMASHAAYYDTNATKGRFPSKGKSDAILDGADFHVELAEKCNQLDLTYGSSTGSYYNYLLEYRSGIRTFESAYEGIEAMIRDAFAGNSSKQ